MNFKLILLFFIFISCGLKKDPIPPTSSLLPSLTDEYSITHKKKEKEKEKESDNEEAKTKKNKK